MSYQLAMHNVQCKETSLVLSKLLP